MKVNNEIETAFLTETINRLNKSFQRINHCLEQLNEESHSINKTQPQITKKTGIYLFNKSLN